MSPLWVTNLKKYIKHISCTSCTKKKKVSYLSLSFLEGCSVCFGLNIKWNILLSNISKHWAFCVCYLELLHPLTSIFLTGFWKIIIGLKYRWYFPALPTGCLTLNIWLSFMAMLNTQEDCTGVLYKIRVGKGKKTHVSGNEWPWVKLRVNVIRYIKKHQRLLKMIASVTVALFAKNKRKYPRLYNQAN